MKIVTVGKHKGKSVAALVLKEQKYLRWVLDHPNLTGGLALVRDEARHLLSIFDAKPLQKSCYGDRNNCTNPVTYATAYKGDSSGLCFWCDSCDPYDLGAAPLRLTEIRTYEDALNHVRSRCGDYDVEYKGIVRALAAAKGLPKRCGEAQAASFFGKIP